MFKVGGVSALYIVLVVFVVFGALHLYAASHSTNKFSQLIVGLGF